MPSSSKVLGKARLPACDFHLPRTNQTEPGGLVFSPPNKRGYVKKLHICKNCHMLMMTVVFGRINWKGR